MANVKVSNKRIRDVQCSVHLAGGLLLVAYIYTPFGGMHAFEALVRFIVVPAIVATGMAMWQLPRLRKRLRDRTRSGAAAKAGSDADGSDARAKPYGSGVAREGRV